MTGGHQAGVVLLSPFLLVPADARFRQVPGTSKLQVPFPLGFSISVPGTSLQALIRIIFCQESNIMCRINSGVNTHFSNNLPYP